VDAIAIIQARLSSKRLPSKALLAIANKPIIWHIHKRLTMSKLVKKIVIATSKDISDDPLVSFLDQSNISYYRGSLDDVFTRFKDVIDLNPWCKYIVRVTADSPFVSADFIDGQVAALKSFDADLVSSNAGSVLDGQVVMSKRAFNRAYALTKTKEDKEHVASLFISDNPHLFRVVEVVVPNKFKNDIRLSVDEQMDYELCKKLYNDLWDGVISLNDVLDYLNHNPDIAKLNNNIKHKPINIVVKDKLSLWANIDKVGKYIVKDIAY
jgi:spore coat polysaccharide biosynthesis protein SpsF